MNQLEENTKELLAESLRKSAQYAYQLSGLDFHVLSRVLQKLSLLVELTELNNQKHHTRVNFGAFALDLGKTLKKHFGTEEKETFGGDK